MRKLVLTAAALGLAASAIVSPAMAGANPMLGAAAVKTLTADENKAVLGKGSYSDYYGGYGIQYAYYSYYYGYYGKYYDSASYYKAASTYGYYAYYYFYYASYYANNS